MHIVFMGTTDFSVTILNALALRHTIDLVVTQPDRPFGRKQLLKSPPVKEVALKNGFSVFQPEKVKLDCQPILDIHPDIIVVAAYGQLIPKQILQAPRYGCINVHASLLPKYRGGSPMHTAIKNGELETGVTIMNMVMKMDAGDILNQAALPILDTDDVGRLEQKLAVLGSRLLLETIDAIENQSAQAIPQDESQVTFAWNIKPEEEKLDFSQTTQAIYNHVRAFHPWPLTYFMIDEQPIKVLAVTKESLLPPQALSALPGEIISVQKGVVGIRTLDGMISLKTIQPAGRNPMSIKDYMNGAGKTVFVMGKRII